MTVEKTAAAGSAPATTTTDNTRLIVVSQEPFNAETPLAEQIGLVTPNPLFYVRSNFTIPRLDAAAWRLSIGGEVERTVQLTYDEVRALPSRSLLVTLECAGNGRSYLRPAVSGEPWCYGAVSTAEWTGVSLGAVLETAGLRPGAREIVIQGADQGRVTGRAEPIPFDRSLGLRKALDPDTLLAYAMNGELLSPEHGFPLRLLVPGWYGMASVKWVTHIEAGAQPFRGYYQAERYIMVPQEHDETTATPLTTIRLRSLITTPATGAVLARGPQRIRGLAWSGAAPVTGVEVSVDGGLTWEPASFASAAERYAWRRWEYLWQATTSGAATLCSRAVDAEGHVQPPQPEWNRLGYANNAVQGVAVKVA